MNNDLIELQEMKMKGTPYFNENKWVSPLNFMKEALFNKFPKKVKIHDVTLRDGEQTCGLVWREDERIRIAESLNDLGVDRIEVGMPIVSDENMRAIKHLTSMNLKSKIVAFCRALNKDIDAAYESGVNSIIVEHVVNPYVNEFVYKSSAEEVISRVVECIHYAKDKDMQVTFMGWDTTRSNLDYVLKIFSEIAQKASPKSVVFVDSFGVATPFTIYFVFKELKKLISESIELEFHVHNEFGLAMGSVIAAIAGGARMIHSSINSLGERTGNVATEQVVTALEILLNIDTGVDLTKLWRVSKLVQDISKISPGYNSPVIGEKLFWVESGIVVDALKKLNAKGIKSAMTPYMPNLVGRKGPIIKLGAFSGKSSVKLFLETKNISVNNDEFERICKKIHYEGRIRRTVLEESEILRIIHKVIE